MRPACMAKWLSVIAASVLAVSCASNESPANSNSKGEAANSNSSSAFTFNPARFSVAEPERYSLLLRLGEAPPPAPAQPAPKSPAAIKPAGDASQAARVDKSPGKRASDLTVKIPNPTPVSPGQFELDKLGTDRRWSFQLEGLGSVVYLEKSGLKYLVLFDRKQYFEVSPADLGFDAGRLLNPVTAATQYLTRLEYEGLGSDEVAARSALRFRFSPKPGDNVIGLVKWLISVDIETRLPLRFETDSATPSEAHSKSLLEAETLKLSPSRAIFDVPSGMNKIKTEAAGAYIQLFVGGVKRFIDALNPLKPPTVAQAQPSVNPNAAANANKNRRAGKSPGAPASRNRKGAIGAR